VEKSLHEQWLQTEHLQSMETILIPVPFLTKTKQPSIMSQLPMDISKQCLDHIIEFLRMPDILDLGSDLAYLLYYVLEYDTYMLEWFCHSMESLKPKLLNRRDNLR
jgi:hypothetical protein